jgi:hypothetical protein
MATYYKLHCRFTKLSMDENIKYEYVHLLWREEQKI